MRYYRSARRGGGAVFFAVLAVFLCFALLFTGIFYWSGSAHETISVSKTYYFLVRDCEDTTASAVAGQIYFSGGAGYIQEAGGKSAVVLSCYFTENDAQFVRSAMAEKGVEVSVRKLSAKDFSLSGSACAERSRLLSNAETAETCAKILFDTANGLERTAVSQDEARAAVRGVYKVLKGLREGNAGGLYDRWNAALYQTERRARETAEGILFAKDLRYLQVQLCDFIVNFNDYFT